MSNITPTKPAFAFGYWRPWNEDSNVFNSYFDYTRDISLVNYAADTIGNYINQASKEQVQAINQLGQSIGQGMNILSNQISNIDRSLDFLNRNLDIQIEQQIISNLLLQNIIELLRVPESEKERQHNIELGLKFFVNASLDADLYEDALEELLKAESLMRQDYFVLHRIGCIYLYAAKYINPEKACDYFLRAAKYASVETNKQAIRSYNVLTLNSDNKKVKSLEQELKAYENDFDWDDYPELEDSGYNGWYFEKYTYELYTVSDYIDDGYYCSEEDKIYFQSLIDDQSTNEELRNELIKIRNTVNNILNKYGYINSNISSIHSIAADAYQKAAFTSYIMGRFSDAVNYQSRALKFESAPQNRFLLAKYQVRNGDISEGVLSLSKSIDDEPIYAVAAFKEIDLINQPEILNLISEKNQNIDKQIRELMDQWKVVESITAQDVIKELSELSEKSYEIKVSKFLSLKEKALDINKKVSLKLSEIEAYIDVINNTTYCTHDANDIQGIIHSLIEARNSTYEKMQQELESVKIRLEADKIKIGSRYAGGLVFYIDKTGNHGLVCAEEDFGEDKTLDLGVLGSRKLKVAIWGGEGEIGADENGIADGGGMRNSIKIVEHASWVFHKSWGQITKSPAPTAARFCLECNHNGFKDWYLPTYAELGLISRNLCLNGLGNFQGGSYWSSTQYEPYPGLHNYARMHYFYGTKLPDYDERNGRNSVRPVRAF